MNAVERQTLLDEATARPWRVVASLSPRDPAYIRAADDKTVAARLRSEQHAGLIVAAVNEYEALLACESGLRALVGFLRPDNAHARHARAALESLDDIRRTA